MLVEAAALRRLDELSDSTFPLSEPTRLLRQLYDRCGRQPFPTPKPKTR
jgi:hypothetical protein